jgi:hypothetical protein
LFVFLISAGPSKFCKWIRLWMNQITHNFSSKCQHLPQLIATITVCVNIIISKSVTTDHIFYKKCKCLFSNQFSCLTSYIFITVIITSEFSWLFCNCVHHFHAIFTIFLIHQFIIPLFSPQTSGFLFNCSCLRCIVSFSIHKSPDSIWQFFSFAEPLTVCVSRQPALNDNQTEYESKLCVPVITSRLVHITAFETESVCWIDIFHDYL